MYIRQTERYIPMCTYQYVSTYWSAISPPSSSNMLLTGPFPIVNVTYSKGEDGWKGDKIEGDERDAEFHIRRKRIAGVLLKGHGTEIDNELSTIYACKELECCESYPLCPQRGQPAAG